MPTSRRSTPPVPRAALGALGAALALLAPALAAAGQSDRPMLAGTWTINRSLSTPAGSVPTPDVTPDDEPDMDQIGRGVYGRRGAFGPGGRSGRGPGGARAREEDLATRRALMDELLAMPASLTIAQDGDRLSFVEPDGIARIYYANNRTEKHQLLNGTIETKSRWDDGALVMELAPRGGPTITRRYAVRPGVPGQLEITTRVDRDRKGVKRVAVYEAAAASGSPDPAGRESRSNE
jgi:hypothetical protein